MKKKKQKNTFHRRQPRDQKWTEAPVGRPIDFADKYSEGGVSDKFDSKRPDSMVVDAARRREKKEKRKKRALTLLMAVVLIAVGYTAMDVHITRHAVPVKKLATAENTESGNMAELSLAFAAKKTESVSLDSAVMLSAVIKEAGDEGYSSVAFDMKRSDGTIGYASALASTDTFGAVANPAAKPAASVKALIENDLLPVARVCCYLDNVVPAQAEDMALTRDGKLYRDSDGNTYLNPDSEQTYLYLKDIIQECHAYGITVFVLSGCDLPEEVREGHADGFAILAQKLSKEFEGEVKLLEEKDAALSGRDAESGEMTAAAVKKEISELAPLADDQAYYITAPKLSYEEAAKALREAGIANYILEG